MSFGPRDVRLILPAPHGSPMHIRQTVDKLVHLAPSSGWAMSAFQPLSGDQRTSGEQAINDASNPKPTLGLSA
jgi:hypothetical protein